MQSISYTITDELGIHARPAGQIVKFLQGVESDVKVHANDKTANAKGIMGLMSLAAKQGTEVTFDVEGSDEKEVAEKLLEFLKENL